MTTYDGGEKVEAAWRWMNSADRQLDDDLYQHLTSHCYTPVFDAVVHRRKLCTSHYDQ